MSIMDSTTPASGRDEPIPVNRFALFSETLLAGLLVLVLSIPLVTIPAAYAAGIAHLERHLSGRDDSVRALWGTFRAALPGSWKLGITTAAAAVVIVLNLLLATVGQLPGQRGGPPGHADPGGCRRRPAPAHRRSVVRFRRTVTESDVSLQPHPHPQPSPSAAWSSALEAGKTLSLRDWTGSLLLAAALFAAVVFVWMLVALFVVVPGTLILAAASVKIRSTRT